MRDANNKETINNYVFSGMTSRFSGARLSSTGSLTWRIVQFVGGAILFKDYVAEAALCAGESMLPTLNSEGDILLVEKLGTTLRTIKRGDVVVCTSPSDPDKLICKRVIGMVIFSFKDTFY